MYDVIHIHKREITIKRGGLEVKPTEVQQEFIKLRAEGRSYSYITDKLHISKSTCSKWESKLAEEIAQLKREELNTLYDSYYMKKEARIKQLGETLKRVDDALEDIDLRAVPPEKLLDFKMKYMEALQKEYVDTEPALNIGDEPEAKDIIKAYADLLNRVRAGKVPTEQVSKECLVLSNILKAYEVTEIKAKLDEIEAMIGSR